MMATIKASNGDPYQASRAIYQELEDLMADGKSMELSFSELEDLLLEGYDNLVHQLYQDFLAMVEKGETEAAEDDSEDQCQEVVNDPNPDLSHADSSPPEAGPDNQVLTADSRGIDMRTDAPCLAPAQAAHQSTGVSINLFKCRKHIAGVDAGYDDIPIPLFPQSSLSTSDDTAVHHKSGHVDNERPIVIKGVVVVVSQNVIESRSPVHLLELPCRPRPVWCRASTTNNIIPRAA